MYIFSLGKPRSSKRQTKLNKKKLFTSFKNYSRKQYSKNSDIAADTNHTQKENLQKYSKQNFSIQNYFSPDISKRNLVKSIKNEKKLVRREKKKSSCFCLLLKICIKKKKITTFIHVSLRVQTSGD